MRGARFGPGEWRGGLRAAASMLPFTLSYGFIAFGIVGPAATQAGDTASVFGVVVGEVLLAPRRILQVAPASTSHFPSPTAPDAMVERTVFIIDDDSGVRKSIRELASPWDSRRRR